MYKFLYTERNNQKATEFETKSLLYLLSMREDSKEIDTFLIDCFNDVTGCNNTCNKLWDVQSKGVKSLTPKTIGCSLITLFENFISSIDFDFYILFFPKLNNNYFINTHLTVFNIDNFKMDNINKITNGLKEEYIRRHANTQIEENLEILIEEFIKKITFVMAEESKSKYIKNIMELKNAFKKDDIFFNSIFDEIRDQQSVLKNISIHGKQINDVSEVLRFNKYLRKQNIEMLIVDRIVGTNIFKNSRIPIGFSPFVKDLETNEIRDLIQKCDSELSLMFFNNSDKKDFWILFEKIYFLVKNNIDDDIDSIFNKVKNEKLIRSKVLSELSTKYFITLIEEGVENENN